MALMPSLEESTHSIPSVLNAFCYAHISKCLGREANFYHLGHVSASWPLLGRKRCDLSKSLGFSLVFIMGGHHNLPHKQDNTQ